MFRTVLTLALLGHVLDAEARRPPPPSDIASADPFVLIVGVCFVLAYFVVKTAFRFSTAKGYQATAVCVALGAFAIAYPVLWTVCALAVPAFFLSYVLKGWRT